MAERRSPAPGKPEITRPEAKPEITRPEAVPEIKPEYGVAEYDGGVMLTTAEILDFSEGVDSDQPP